MGITQLELTDKKFGSLTAAWPVGRQNKSIVWLCFCNCGKTRFVKANNLKGGLTSSCGCAKNKPRIHGHASGGEPSPTYKTWGHMKQRCLNPKTIQYGDYGGRGITICDRWVHSFENFLVDMGLKPDGKSLDRINVQGNYEPSNCQWASISDQQKNKRKKLAIESFSNSELLEEVNRRGLNGK